MSPAVENRKPRVSRAFRSTLETAGIEPACRFHRDLTDVSLPPVSRLPFIGVS